jgi:SAM-dependent methyltransferase
MRFALLSVLGALLCTYPTASGLATPPEDPTEEDNGQYAKEYWFDPRIHSFGNVGIGGKFHATCAPFVTRLIDAVAYGGRDVRLEVTMDVAQRFTQTHGEPPKTVVDLGCGTGQSTRAWAEALPHAHVTGVDTSSEMLATARGPLGFAQATYCEANAEQTGIASGSADIVSVMYSLHEMPEQGRAAVLAEVSRLLSPRGVAVILDIDTSYKPSVSMAAGEPYIWSYLAGAHMDIGRAFGVSVTDAPQLRTVKFGQGVEHRIVVHNHASLWMFAPSMVPAVNNVLPTEGVLGHSLAEAARLAAFADIAADLRDQQQAINDLLDE